MELCGLLDDRADTTSADNRPDEEGDTGARNEVGFDREQMTDFVDGKPDGRQGAQPENEEGNPVSCGCARVVGEGIMNRITVLMNDVSM